MPTRRTLLALAGSSASLALAGCSALEDDSENGNNNDPNPGTESPSAGDPVNTDPPGGGVSARTAATNYDIGFSEYNTGIEKRNTSVDQYNSELYTAAITAAEQAKSSFRDAEDSFGTAVQKAAETDNQEALRICREARDSARTMAQAMEAAKDSAEWAREDEIDLANEASDESTELERQAGTIESPGTLEAIFGI